MFDVNVLFDIHNTNFSKRNKEIPAAIGRSPSVEQSTRYHCQIRLNMFNLTISIACGV